MPQHEYSAADVRVIDSRVDNHFRRSPRMYFGVTADNPVLPTKILERAVTNALHPAALVPRDIYADDHVPIVRVEVIGDLAFTITDDQAMPIDNAYFGSLLNFDRFMLAAAATYSRHAVVEVWQDGRGLHQHLDHLHAVAPPCEFDPPTPRGTRATFHLDPVVLAPGASTTTGVYCHYCTAPTPCDLVIHDLR